MQGHEEDNIRLYDYNNVVQGHQEDHIGQSDQETTGKPVIVEHLIIWSLECFPSMDNNLFCTKF